MTSKQKLGVIFDLDGVIIDSSKVMEVAFAYAFKKFFPDDPVPFQQYTQHLGKGFLKIMDEMRLTHEMYPYFYSKSMELSSAIVVYDGLISLLERLKESGCYLGISTGKDSLRTKQILNEKNLALYFDRVICSDELREGKPHPDSINLHLIPSRINKNNMLFVGDSISDTQCARYAGVRSIAALWGMGALKELLQESPDYIAFDVNDLVWILSLNGMLKNKTRDVL